MMDSYNHKCDIYWHIFLPNTKNAGLVALHGQNMQTTISKCMYFANCHG